MCLLWEIRYKYLTKGEITLLKELADRNYMINKKQIREEHFHYRAED